MSVLFYFNVISLFMVFTPQSTLETTATQPRIIAGDRKSVDFFDGNGKAQPLRYVALLCNRKKERKRKSEGGS